VNPWDKEAPVKSLAAGSGIVVAMVLLLWGCERKDAPLSESKDAEPAPQATGRVAFHVTYMTPHSVVAKPAAVDTMTAYVYEPDGTEIIHVNLEKVGDRGQASVSVVAGLDRRVDIVAYDAGLVSWLGSDADVDVVAGQTTTADVEMKTFVPSLTVPASPDTDGAYKLTWTAVEGAVSYLVNETQELLPAIYPVYEGAGISTAVTGRKDGTYWYSVRATGDYGDGKFCEACSVVVEIPPPGGTIDIDVPWPPDDGGAPKTGDVSVFDLPGGATMDMVWIEPGMFKMGSPSSESGRGTDESPQHYVTITKGFWLGRCEVTQGGWEAVMLSLPWSGKGNVRDPCPDCPAVFVSWDDMQAFIGELNKGEGTEVYRLPTEAEWEYACRAGTSTPWSFGDNETQLGEYAWYYGNAGGAGEPYAHEVGTKLPNPWGLYDMHGNVAEHCDDWYGPYPSSGQTDPTGPDSGSYRVRRGGVFSSSAAGVRSGQRDYYASSHPDAYVGVRVVRQEP
jgi:formylglycine-generating enzyme required for sulfatase activity